MELGNYQLIRKLATGGMAELFLARQKSVAGFQRNVVVKRILPEFCDDPSFVESFLNEAKLSAQLNHPNIVQIYDLGKVGKSYFIAMEYIKGFDLSALVRLNRRAHTYFPIGVGITIVADVCAGLDYAHHAADIDGNLLGIVHRDVTPSNVIVPMDGQAKVVDFGIAKATARSDGKTKTGTIKGKVSYLAPEQVLGLPLDKRVDVFACGIMLYEVLANKNPFRGETDYASLQNIVNGHIRPVRELRPDIPEALEATVMRALERDTAKRYATCGQLQGALENATRSGGIAISRADVHDYMLANEAALIEELKPGADDQFLEELDQVNTSNHVLGGDRTEVSEPLSLASVASPPTLAPPAGKKKWAVPLIAIGVAIVAATIFMTQQHRRDPVAVESAMETGLEIVTQPPGAQVVIDDRLYSGVTPLTVTGLLSGKTYRVLVEREGHAPTTSDVHVDRPGLRTVQLTLARQTSRAGGPARPVVRAEPQRPDRPVKKKDERPAVAAAGSAGVVGTGKLKVIVQPWASVEIDGVAHGQTPIAPIELPAGMHTVVLRNEELKKNVRMKVDIKRGLEEPIRVNWLD